jgi:hypothetical protein
MAVLTLSWDTVHVALLFTRVVEIGGFVGFFADKLRSMRYALHLSNLQSELSRLTPRERISVIVAAASVIIEYQSDDFSVGKQVENIAFGRDNSPELALRFFELIENNLSLINKSKKDILAQAAIGDDFEYSMHMNTKILVYQCGIRLILVGLARKADDNFADKSKMLSDFFVGSRDLIEREIASIKAREDLTRSVIGRRRTTDYDLLGQKAEIIKSEISLFW